LRPGSLSTGELSFFEVVGDPSNISKGVLRRSKVLKDTYLFASFISLDITVFTEG